MPLYNEIRLKSVLDQFMILKKHVMILKVVLVLGVASRAFADGPYAYSEQKIKKFHDPHAHSGHHGELSHIGSHKPEHHEGYASAYPGYEFSYKVEDHHTHDYKGQHEVRDGDVVKGMYWLIQPDGKKRTVTYHADKHSGFHAHVEYSDPDHHVYHKKEHEHHQEPEHHIKLQEHHVEHHDEHKKEGYHQKYYIKPYGYYSKVIHSKPHKHVEYHEHHEEVPKEHHVEVHEEHHEEAHKEHHEEHHIPHSDYNVHIKHPTYYSHHGNEHHHEHKSKVEEHHKEHEIKPVVEEIDEEPYKHHDGHHKVTYYDRIKKIYAHHLEKPHHEQHGEGYHNKHDDEHILYIDHKLLEELRRKAYEAFKAHEHQKHKEHHGHQDHSRHHYPIHHARKYYHHIVPVSGRKHYDY